jgi:hypothetical protein
MLLFRRVRWIAVERITILDNPELIKLSIEISASNTVDNDIDQMICRLLFDFRGMDVESAELAKSSLAPSGTKSVDPAMIRSIVVSVFPVAPPTIVGLVHAWVICGQGGTTKFKGEVSKEMVEFGGSAQNLLVTFSEWKKKK